MAMNEAVIRDRAAEISELVRSYLSPKAAQERLAEFEWAFGNDAEEKMEQIAIELARLITAAYEHSAEAL